VDDAAPRRGGIAASGSFPSGGAPTVALPALDAPGVSVQRGVAGAGTRRGVCVFQRLLTAPSPRGAFPVWDQGARGMREQMRTGMPAHLCQERSPCAVRAPPVRTRAGRPRTRRKPQVRAPPVRTRAGRPRTRRKPQVRAPPVRTRAGRAARQELDAEFRTSGAHAGRTPALPAQTSGARALAGSGLLASPGVPSFLSGIRTPKLPLLPQGEQGAGGMRGQTHTGMQKITHRSQELYP
jgi:hypothetical protein